MAFVLRWNFLLFICYIYVFYYAFEKMLTNALIRVRSLTNLTLFSLLIYDMFYVIYKMIYELWWKIEKYE